jgi:hypothetical protein
MRKSLALTFDTEWSPPEVVGYTLDILEDYGYTGTFFCTDKSNRNIRLHELALHPNFLREKSEAQILSALQVHFPNAKGARSHCSYFHTNLPDLYSRKGIAYDSSYLMPNVEVEPFPLFEHVYEIPMYFLDNYSVSTRRWAVEFSAIPEVFDFHPVHIYLNTNDASLYLKAKKWWKNPERLWRMRDTRKRGVHDYFIHILEMIRKHNVQLLTMSEIYEKYSKA